LKNHLLQQTLILFKKEVLAEWRNRFALLSILILLLCSVFIVYTIQDTTDNESWHSLFYVMLIFGVIQNIGRSFLSESRQIMQYYRNLVDNRALIASKILYQFMINSIFLALLFALMNFFLIQEIYYLGQYLITALLFTLCNSVIFTFNAAIASSARNSGLIASVLSLPLLLPNLIVSLKVAGKSLMEVGNLSFIQDWLILMLLILLVSVLSLVLFRNIWVS
jgi:ABC-type transport system involved in cytochrome c biogenesis permease component